MTRSSTRRRAASTDIHNVADPVSLGGVPIDEALGGLNEFERQHAPKHLFLAGDRSLLQRRPKVSIVGSRSASDEGLRRAAKLARVLVKDGVVVVSGLALGIDTAAHRAAIDEGGRTIAVIGTPLTQTYPRENAALQARLGEEHLVVSQFAPGYPVRRANFPIRNRTMALIVDASVIVEAGETSGSLSQGWEALRLGRTLFIMKSVVESDLNWPREMLKYGAIILEDAAQVLETLPYGELAPALL